ncbi:DUF4260 domain-containing protein [Siminovitchia sediminis]|uniref:DUF4260 domain-containing protein n=1 Tax=Siminovitchia sediminis TaxID=1274353 RepID=A0ABW4KII8_9BACI
MNKILLHIEGLAVFALSMYVYGQNEFSWVWFFLLLLVPDISMLGYVVNRRFGAMLYNLFHTYTLAILIVLCGLVLSSSHLLGISMIWTAHIGMDRMLGYGLKYPASFKDTHLNRV